MNSLISYPVDNTKPVLPEKPKANTVGKESLLENSSLLQKKRLLVLISPYVCNETEFSRYVLNMAEHRYSDVLLLMLANSYEDESNGHLRLFTITSLLRGYGFSVASETMWGKSWVSEIEKVIGQSDTIVCPEEVLVPYKIIKKEPLPDQIKRKFSSPMIVYQGFINKENTTLSNIAKSIAFWMGIALLIAGFYLIESLVVSKISGWENTFFLIVLAVAQIAIGYLWFLFLG
jgi:hypothetical protein